MWNHDHNIIMSIVSHAIISLIVCYAKIYNQLLLKQVLTNIIYLSVRVCAQMCQAAMNYISHS